MFNFNDFDCYSIINNILFFNDVDLQVDLSKESLLQQFKIVKRETKTSHVMQYGELVCYLHIIAFLFVYLGRDPFSQNFWVI